MYCTTILIYAKRNCFTFVDYNYIICPIAFIIYTFVRIWRASTNRQHQLIIIDIIHVHKLFDVSFMSKGARLFA